jgi:hypothetical protein
MTTWLDELRIVKGQAVWTSNFTPPTLAYATGDVPAFTGLVTDRLGTFAATEAADAASLTGVVATSGIDASLVTTEATDVASLAGGKVEWLARLAATEAADTASIAGGKVEWKATLAATESTDVASVTGTIAWLGSLAATEAADTAGLAATITTPGSVSLGAVEAPDVVALTGTLGVAPVAGYMAATEAADTISGAGAATLAFQQAVTQGGGASSYTLPFTVVSAAGQERLVALLAISPTSPGTTTFSSVLIDGQTATQVGPYVSVSDTTGGAPLVSFWRAAGTANTSINVTFNTIFQPFDARGAVWTLNNATTLLDFTATTIAPPVSGNLSLDVDTIAGGAAAAVFLAYNSTTRNATWSGLTESFDGAAGSLYGIDWFSTANLNVSSASAPLTVTAGLPTDWTGQSAVAGLAVSFNAVPGGGFTGTLSWPARLAATEAADTASLTGKVEWSARLAAFEADQYELLLHVDGSDGSISIVDSGGSNHTVTAHGAAQIDNSLTVFNGEALLVASSADYVSADTGNYAFDTGDFCIDFRVRLTSGSAPQMFYDGGSAGPQIFYDGAALRYNSPTGAISGSSLSADTNYHIAVTRDLGLTRLFKDGVQQGSTLADTTGYGTSSGYPRIGGGGLPLSRIPWEGGSAYWTAWPKAAAQGWNSPTFFPIAVYLGKPDSGHPAALMAVGINTYVGVEHNPPIAAATTTGMFVIPQSGEWTPAEIGSDGKVVGWFTLDECEQGEGACGAFSTDAERLAYFKARTAEVRALADGRFVFANFGNGVLGTFWAPETMDEYVQDVDGSGVDKYAYTSSGVRFEFGRADSWTVEGGTEANAQSSSAYGWMARRMTRVFNDQNNMTPFWQVVETKMPFLGNETKSIITYAQIEGAVWSAIANEARGIIYFQHNGFYDQGTPPAIDPNTGIAPTTEVYSLVDGPTALKTAITTLNSRVTALAPVINTQSYVFNFGATGIDTMLKTYDGYAYIFASLGVAAATGSKTFTLTGSGITGTTVEVLYESRSRTVTGGQFTDTFANEYSHHIYKVPV